MEGYYVWNDGYPNLDESQGVEAEIISQNARLPRGKSFSVVEDEALCRAWLAISQDPITGNTQTMAVFWDRVVISFNSHPNVQANRNSNSLSHRWSVIQKAVNKFCGYLEQIQMRQQSGTTEANKVCEAKRLFHVLQKKHFTFDTCWEILRHSCKWDEIRTCEKKTTIQTPSSSTPSTPTASASDNDPDQQTSKEKSKRPIGNKAEKESRRKKATQDVRFDDMQANQSKIVEVLAGMSSRSIERDQQRNVERQKKDEHREAKMQLLAMMNEREQRKEDHKIMSMDMSNLTPMQRSYYEGLQKQIMERNNRF